MPSPLKSHDREAMSPLDVSVNCTLSGATPDVGSAVNDATGGGGRVTEITLLTVEVPPGPVTDSPTVWSPAVSNLCVAVGPVASSKAPSASRSHATESTRPVETSVRVTVSGTVPDGG